MRRADRLDAKMFLHAGLVNSDRFLPTPAAFWPNAFLAKGYV